MPAEFDIAIFGPYDSRNRVVLNGVDITKEVLEIPRSGSRLAPT